jgi:hypothetical protein
VVRGPWIRAFGGAGGQGQNFPPPEFKARIPRTKSVTSPYRHPWRSACDGINRRSPRGLRHRLALQSGRGSSHHLSSLLNHPPGGLSLNPTTHLLKNSGHRPLLALSTIPSRPKTLKGVGRGPYGIN